jgi:PHD/YefM family antitoxin component YafN of YafNO toxin-antitoxin module
LQADEFSVDLVAPYGYNIVRILLQGVDTMQIKPSASIRQNYNEIAALCKSSGEPVYLTKNGEGDLVVMDIEAFTRREKMLKLREELLAVEEDRLAGRSGVTPDELDSYLDSAIDEVEHGKEASL